MDRSTVSYILYAPSSPVSGDHSLLEGSPNDPYSQLHYYDIISSQYSRLVPRSHCFTIKGPPASVVGVQVFPTAHRPYGSSSELDYAQYARAVFELVRVLRALRRMILSECVRAVFAHVVASVRKG